MPKKWKAGDDGFYRPYDGTEIKNEHDTVYNFLTELHNAGFPLPVFPGLNKAPIIFSERLNYFELYFEDNEKSLSEILKTEKEYFETKMNIRDNWKGNKRYVSNDTQRQLCLSKGFVFEHSSGLTYKGTYVLEKGKIGFNVENISIKKGLYNYDDLKKPPEKFTLKNLESVSKEYTNIQNMDLHAGFDTYSIYSSKENLIIKNKSGDVQINQDSLLDTKVIFKLEDLENIAKWLLEVSLEPVR